MASLPPVQPAQQSPRLKALQNLSSQLPVANTQVAAGQQAARDMQLQQAVAAAPPKANITQTAQQTGASAAQQAGVQAVERAQQMVQNQGKVAQTGLAEQQTQNQAQVAQSEQGLKQQQMDNVQRLATVSEQAKQELYDKQLQFQKDENGRTMFSTLQLADYARSKSQNEEQYKNYAQSATQLADRNLEAMTHAYQMVQQDLTNKYETAKQQGDQQTMQQIAVMRNEAEAAMEREKARNANNKAAWSAGGTIVGAAAGSFGGPAGAMAGASVGGALGGLAGSQF